MRRLLRWIFNGLTVLSLLLCISTIVLWVRSYSGSDYISRDEGTTHDPTTYSYQSRYLISVRGTIYLSDIRGTEPMGSWEAAQVAARSGAWHAGRLDADEEVFRRPPATSLWNRLGFAAWQQGPHASSSDRALIWTAPAWLPTVGFAILPLIATWNWIRHHRRHLVGLGPTCGYDLRGTPERCPECGTLATVKGAA